MVQATTSFFRIVLNRSVRSDRSGLYFFMHENEIGTLILDAAFEVHKVLGPSLLESSYEHCLAYELLNKGLRVALQKPLPLIYKGDEVGMWLPD